MAWIHPPALDHIFSFLHFPLGRSGHSAVFYGSSLFIFGGFDGKKWLNDVHKFDTTSFIWSQPKISGLFPQPRQYHSALAVEENLYLFGGYNGAGWQEGLIILDMSSLKWIYPKTLGAIPSGREGHSMVSYESYIYIYGGWDGGIIGDLYRIHLQSFIWEKIEILGEKPLLCGHSANVVDGQIMIYGGFNGDSWDNSLYLISLNGFTCQKVKAKGNTVPRGYHSASLVNRHLLVYGGYNGKYILGDLLVLDLKNLAWSSPEPSSGYLPSFRNSHTMSVLGSELFLFGGFNGTSDTNELHILETRAFSTLEDDLSSVLSFTKANQFSVSNQHSAHLCIIKVRCPKLLEVPVKLSDHSTKTLLEYLYHDSLPQGLSKNQRTELSEISSQLGLDRLKSLCENDSDIPESTLAADIAGIMSLPEESDFLVVVEKQEFFLHKVILAARCPYFKSMFDSGLSENSKNRVEFKDFRVSAFEYIVKWIYFDRFSPLFEKEKLRSEELIEILTQSNMLGLESLTKLAEIVSESVISIYNAVQLFEKAHYLGLNRLKSFTVNFILREIENTQIKNQILTISESAFEDLNSHLPKKLKKKLGKSESHLILNLVKLEKTSLKIRGDQNSQVHRKEQNGVFTFRSPVKAKLLVFPGLKQSVYRFQRTKTIRFKPEGVPSRVSSFKRNLNFRNLGISISSNSNILRFSESLTQRTFQ